MIRYALLVYDLEGSLEELVPEGKRSLHRGHANLGEVARESGLEQVAHYRLRPSTHTITVRAGTAGPIRSEGAASAASGTLRALYLVESRDLEAVVELAGRLPAVELGATAEVWPLAEPHPTARHQPNES
jgi:hypothetical protein